MNRANIFSRGHMPQDFIALKPTLYVPSSILKFTLLIIDAGPEVDNTWTVTAEPEFKQTVASCNAIFQIHTREKIQVTQAQKIRIARTPQIAVTDVTQKAHNLC